LHSGAFRYSRRIETNRRENSLESQMQNRTQNKLKILTKALIVTGVIGAVSLPVAAKKYRDHNSYNNSAYDYARVVNVDPIYETYQVNHPIEKCYDKRVPVTYEKRYSDRGSRTPDILGAVIGGAIGNQFGDGRGRKIATVAGAVLGGSIGRDVRRANKHKRHYDRHEPVRYRTVQHCEVKDSYTTKQEIVGYDVDYKYRGNVFHTRLDQDPGEKIKVKVTVNPV